MLHGILVARSVNKHCLAGRKRLNLLKVARLFHGSLFACTLLWYEAEES